MDKSLFDFLSNKIGSSIKENKIPNFNTESVQKELDLLESHEMVRVDWSPAHGNIIYKLSNFYQAYILGGVQPWIDKQKAREELEERLIDSTLNSNKTSRYTSIASVIVAIVTLIVLFVTNQCSKKSDKDFELSTKEIHKSDTQTPTKKLESLLDTLDPYVENTDSLSKTNQKLTN